MQYTNITPTSPNSYMRAFSPTVHERPIYTKLFVLSLLWSIKAILITAYNTRLPTNSYMNTSSPPPHTWASNIHNLLLFSNIQLVWSIKAILILAYNTCLPHQFIHERLLLPPHTWVFNIHKTFSNIKLVWLSKVILITAYNLASPPTNSHMSAFSPLLSNLKFLLCCEVIVLKRIFWLVLYKSFI